MNDKEYTDFAKSLGLEKATYYSLQGEIKKWCNVSSKDTVTVESALFRFGLIAGFLLESMVFYKKQYLIKKDLLENGKKEDRSTILNNYKRTGQIPQYFIRKGR